MELDNLKEVWQADAGNTLPGIKEDILLMLQKKSRSPIAKIKRNLRGEMMVVVVLYSASIIYYIISNKGRYWELALMLFLILAIALSNSRSPERLSIFSGLKKEPYYIWGLTNCT